jgi:ubiquinone/menaquinone biosynthesis C-methylase UbiE
MQSFADIEQLLNGYRQSRTLLTAVELDIFTAIGPAPATATAVASRLQTDPRATAALLDALASLGLLLKKRGAYQNASEAKRFLDTASPECRRAGLLHAVNRWETWGTLTEAVRRGRCILPPGMEASTPEWSQAFIDAMHTRAQAKVPEVLAAVPPRSVHRILDIGGGSGALSIAYTKANPKLHAVLLDLTQVLPFAKAYLRAAGMEKRVTLRAGDLHRSRLGTGFDLVILSAICHLFGPAENKALLRRAHRTLCPGGRILIRETILDADRAGPPAAALFNLQMLTATRHGAAYTEQELRGWLHEAGFEKIRRSPRTGSLLIAKNTPDKP